MILERSADAVEPINRTSLRNLAELGVRVDDEVIRSLVRSKRARPDPAADRICLPSEMVTEALAIAPSDVTVATAERVSRVLSATQMVMGHVFAQALFRWRDGIPVNDEELTFEGVRDVVEGGWIFFRMSTRSGTFGVCCRNRRCWRAPRANGGWRRALTGGSNTRGRKLAGFSPDLPSPAPRLNSRQLFRILRCNRSVDLGWHGTL